jgi:hypothetical protein
MAHSLPNRDGTPVDDPWSAAISLFCGFGGFGMNRFAPVAALVVGLGVAGSGVSGLSAVATVASEGNAYFEALVARADHWKSYSLRDTQQLNFKNLGGYSVESSTSGANLWVTYDPTMDAAKVVIPPFMPGCTLTSAVSASDTTIPISCAINGYWNGGTKRAVRVDGEIMAIIPPTTTGNFLTVQRGSFGTVATPHGSGANAQWNTNSLQSQVRVPLGTSDGNSYFFTWDALWTDSYLLSGLTNHKAFQFGSDGIWFEPQTGFDGAKKEGFSQANAVAVSTARTYNWIGGPADWSQTDGNAAGPGVTLADPINPRLTMPTIYPNRWTRFWVRIDQRANNYELVSMWFADEQQAPMQIYKDLLLSVRPKVNTVQDFWLEFNTSTDSYVRGPGQRNFVSYVRNFVALRNTADITSLLLRPSAGVPLPGGPPPVPTAPGNLRIIR